jgi:site-specific DNA-methyltransferase (cytosine-N4-specific)
MYTTNLGNFLKGNAEEVINNDLLPKYEHSIDLIFTSPPFPLVRKKKYGNLEGEEYINWICGFAPVFKRLLKPQGSIVIEIGNAWNAGEPTMSTLPLETLLAFQKAGGFSLCETFIYNNPSRLPGPTNWVNVERIRVKDSFTYIWWLSPTPRPKANNKNVLQEYSQAMLKLIKNQKYNPGLRPSGHRIGRTSFNTDNKGSIPSNVISLSNNGGNVDYLKYCREHEVVPHPARMPIDLPKFFIKFLTDENDMVLDPFAGSNTTGAAAESLSRKWISIESTEEYIKGSIGRFPKNVVRQVELKELTDV